MISLALALNLLASATLDVPDLGRALDISQIHLPPVTLAPKEKSCQDTRMSDDFRPIVTGVVLSTAQGYAVALLGLQTKPPDSVRTVLGYFVVDDGQPTYVIIHPGKIERFFVPGLSSGRHDATIGTIYILQDGTVKWINAFGNCFIMKTRLDL